MTSESHGLSLWSIMYRLQILICTALMLGVTALIVIQVILRYVFHAPLMGIEELVSFPTIWLYFLGGAQASMERSHIDCGILKVYIKSEKALKYMNILKTLISFIICIWLTYLAYGYFLYSYHVWKTSNLLYIPLFYGESAIFICLLLMAIYTFVELKDYITSSKRSKFDEGREI
ncbi:TRAP-type C4-dicarboxylate transport system, small permease component [Acetomicrobium mobile DSM 13181]|uniref:TRAP-type C4-dicarboxylate transport system, small permease component n=1 Tax=Acetomicrobium mobile (strain ATCC BAA-54 / DSM 13181 / JCM 12221 / NGA) TaxID=891968 RepID=I4BY60_ACEMN|nr:TRAP transporter small permease subunit [Acetomicrobium mobile]AFM22217.1 TRAP-type C4-dicarboxylate transport system, small permease component [Acetomicrobium mobile DSM 13181]